MSLELDESVLKTLAVLAMLPVIATIVCNIPVFLLKDPIVRNRLMCELTMMVVLVLDWFKTEVYGMVMFHYTLVKNAQTKMDFVLSVALPMLQAAMMVCIFPLFLLFISLYLIVICSRLFPLMTNNARRRWTAAAVILWIVAFSGDYRGVLYHGGCTYDFNVVNFSVYCLIAFVFAVTTDAGMMTVVQVCIDIQNVVRRVKVIKYGLLGRLVMV